MSETDSNKSRKYHYFTLVVQPVLFVDGHAPLFGHAHQIIPEALRRWDGLPTLLDDKLEVAPVLFRVCNGDAIGLARRDVGNRGSAATLQTRNRTDARETRRRHEKTLIGCLGAPRPQGSRGQGAVLSAVLSSEARSDAAGETR